MVQIHPPSAETLHALLKFAFALGLAAFALAMVNFAIEQDDPDEG